MGVDVSADDVNDSAPPSQPGEWLEHSPILTVLIVLLAAGWIINEFFRQNAMIAISNLNTYNFIFIMVGLLLHWRPRRFLDAVKKAVPATAGVLIQFPFYGGIAAILTQPKNGAGLTVSDQIAHAFVSLTTQHTYPLAIGALFRGARLFRAVGRRQMAAGGALSDAGRQRSESPSWLGRPDL